MRPKLSILHKATNQRIVKDDRPFPRSNETAAEQGNGGTQQPTHLNWRATVESRSPGMSTGNTIYDFYDTGQSTNCVNKWALVLTQVNHATGCFDDSKQCHSL